MKKKKRSVTLIEIMIVIVLIGLIGGALAINMRGSMDKGKVFKSDQNANRVYDSLMIAYATGQFKLEDYNKPETVEAVLKDSPLIKDHQKVLKDGWNQALRIIKKDNEDDLEVYSEKSRQWHAAHPGQD